MDKNSVTGIVLIMAMLLGYQYFFAPKEPIENPKAKIEATTAKNKAIVQANAGSTSKAINVAPSDTSIKEELSILENNDKNAAT
jgi:YidC/Oxa1 family membrane protein insertase